MQQFTCYNKQLLVYNVYKYKYNIYIICTLSKYFQCYLIYRLLKLRALMKFLLIATNILIY